VELTVVGAGPAYSDDPGSAGAAYLVRHGPEAILLDLGQGAFARLASRIEPSALEGILVSHLHPDHFVDLVALRHYLLYEFDPPRRVRVLAPAGLSERLDGLLGEAGFAGAALEVEALEPGSRHLGSFAVEAGLVTHAPPSFGFRVAAPGGRRGLVYSGDVGVADDLRPLIRVGDVLLIEASFGPGPVPSGAEHLDGPRVGRLAAATRPSRVLLTHLQMGFDPAATIAAVRSSFDGPVELVTPGFVTEI